MKLFLFLSFLFCLSTPPVFAETPPTPSVQSAQKGWLGIGLKELGINDAKLHGYNHALAQVTIVGADTPAETSGIQAGDIIVAMNGKPLMGVNDLISRVKGTKPATEITLQILKDKKETDVIVLLGLRPDDAKAFNRMYIGKPAEAIDIITINTKEKIDLSAYKGKVVLLDFWATWCGPCIDSIPYISKLSTAYKENGLEVIGISSEKLSVIRRFIRTNPVPYTMAAYSPEPTAKRYFVSALPTIYLIDKRGVLREIIVGSGNKDTLQKRIVTLLNE